jgi:hypothetical protein
MSVVILFPSVDSRVRVFLAALWLSPVFFVFGDIKIRGTQRLIGLIWQPTHTGRVAEALWAADRIETLTPRS